MLGYVCILLFVEMHHHKSVIIIYRHGMGKLSTVEVGDGAVQTTCCIFSSVNSQDHLRALLAFLSVLFIARV